MELSEIMEGEFSRVVELLRVLIDRWRDKVRNMKPDPPEGVVRCEIRLVVGSRL
jgi:hypothetical protein